MLNNFNGDYAAAAAAYCGLEAKFTTPDGKTAILYIADGFADPWVLTPNSVDIIINSVRLIISPLFTYFFGNFFFVYLLTFFILF